MILSFQIDNQNFQINLAHSVDLSIPLKFNGAQPNAYGVEQATSKPCEAESLIGDTRRGGSCNFEQITFIPHCNGTHTECVGHITHERISVRDRLKDAFIPAILISIEPENAFQTGESYPVDLQETDLLITRKAIENALEKIKAHHSSLTIHHSLIVRTLPNDESKLSKTYLEEIPPFFSTEAIKFISELKINHLLVDLPSIDRIFDEGKLSNHRIFWNVEPGSFETNEESFVQRTVTELIFVPANVKDGTYFLNLQIAPFAADAAPSRPVIFEISAQ